MTDPAVVKFYDDNSTEPIPWNTAHWRYIGRFTITVPPIDPGDWAVGSDGFVNEFDLYIEDPDDPDYVWVVYFGTDTDGSIPDATVTAGFSFDSDAPTGPWDWWGVNRWPMAWYAAQYPNGDIWDGAWNGEFEVAQTMEIDPTSNPDWYVVVLPAWGTPTINTPTAGQDFNAAYDDSITVTWTVAAGGGGMQFFEVEIIDDASSAVLAGTGVSSGPYPVVLSLPFPGTAGPATVRVRAKPFNTYDWSDWATQSIDLTTPAVSTVDCLEDEVLADNPHFLYMFREETPLRDVDDLSPSDADLTWTYPAASASGKGAIASLSTGTPAYPSYRRRTAATSGGGSTSIPWGFYGIVAGDILIIGVVTFAANTVSLSGSGWVIDVNTTRDGSRFFSAHKTASGGEPNTTITVTGPGSTAFDWQDSAVRGDTTTAIDFIEVAEVSGGQGEWPAFNATDHNNLLHMLQMISTPSLSGDSGHIQGIWYDNYGGSGASATNTSASSSEPFAIASGVGNSRYKDMPTSPWDVVAYDGIGDVSGGRVAVIYGFAPLTPHTATTHNVPKPSASVGQIMYITIAAQLGNPSISFGGDTAFGETERHPAITTPSGWALIDTHAVGHTRWSLYKRTVDGTEPSNIPFVVDGVSMRAQYHRLVAQDPTTHPTHPLVAEPALYTAASYAAGVSFDLGATPDDTLAHLFAVEWWASRGTTYDSDVVLGTWTPTQETTSSRAVAWKRFPDEDLEATVSGTSHPSYGDIEQGVVLAWAANSQAVFPTRGEPAPICDPDCADDNYYLSAESLSGRSVALVPGTFTGDEYTLELLVRSREDGQVNLIMEGAGASSVFVLDVEYDNVSGTVRSSGGFSKTVSATGIPGLQPDCWVHVVLVHRVVSGAGKLRVFVNNNVVDADTTVGNILDTDWKADVTVIDADIALAAGYPTAFGKDRVAAHFSHLCNLCARGFRPPVRINQRTDENGRIAFHSRAVQLRPDRILGANAIV